MTHHQFRGVLVDAQTGEKVIPNEFNAFVSPRMPVVQNGTVSYEGSKKVIYLYPPPPNWLSPDRKWLLWSDGYPVTRSWWAATLDGTQHRQWKAANKESVYALWLPGSQEWMEVTQSDRVFSRLLIHSLSSTEKTRMVRLKGVGDTLLLGITKAHTILVRYLVLSLPEYRSQVEMAVIGYGHPVEEAHHFWVRLPKPAEVADVILSPDGDKLAWFLSLPKSETGEVWLSDVDGKQMRMVGKLTGTGAWHRSAHWLPDGRHLSIEDEQVVWTVPVP